MKPSTSKYDLREHLSVVRPFVSKSIMFSWIAGLLVLAPTFYMLEVYDRVVNSRNGFTLLMLTIVVLFAYAIMEVLEWARSETMREAGVAWDRRMAPRVFTAVHLHNLRQPGLATIQPMNDHRTVRQFFHHPMLGAVMESPVALVFLLVIFSFHPTLFWFSLVGAVVQVALAAWTEQRTQSPLLEANRSALAAQQYIDGTLRNAEVIAAMGMQDPIHRRWYRLHQSFLKQQALASDRAGALQAASKWVQMVMSSLLLGLGAWLVLENALPGGAGAMIVGSVLGARVLSPLVQVIAHWKAWVNVREAWARLEELLQKHPTSEPTMALPPPRGTVSVEQLVAAAPGSPTPILKGISFALGSGEVLAVIGPSASGKTTLARLLLGLWPASSGKVRLDGVDVFGWNKQELGPHVGYLPQGVELLEGSIAENIARFGRVDMGLVQSAAQSAGIHEWIDSLLDGYQTQIGPEGAALSGGQRQRLALARAVYQRPALVVLDEPNASLDDAGDAALLNLIRTMKSQGTTFVVITHRTNVMPVTDKILLLREGTQQAFGARDDVLTALKKGAQSVGSTPARGLATSQGSAR